MASEDLGSQIGTLYEEHGARARRVAYLLCGDHARAEDIVQDAFVRIMGRMWGLRDHGALPAYLNRTIVNLAKNEHRRASRLAGFVARGQIPQVEVPPAIEEKAELHGRLMELPYRQRAAVVLRYCEDLSEAAVAEAMETSTKAIRSLVGRAMTSLRNGTGVDDERP